MWRSRDRSGPYGEGKISASMQGSSRAGAAAEREEATPLARVYLRRQMGRRTTSPPPDLCCRPRRCLMSSFSSLRTSSEETENYSAVITPTHYDVGVRVSINGGV